MLFISVYWFWHSCFRELKIGLFVKKKEPYHRGNERFVYSVSNLPEHANLATLSQRMAPSFVLIQKKQNIKALYPLSVCYVKADYNHRLKRVSVSANFIV
jgi:hypothetical protein